MFVRMTAITEKLRSDLLALSEQDRQELADLLLDSLDSTDLDEESPEFLAELARREADMLSGKSVPIPAEEVFARLDARLAALHRQ